MTLHEYIDKNGVRTRYIYAKSEEEFLRNKAMYVKTDQTTRIMRQIEDRDDDINYMKRWRVGAILFLLLALGSIIFGALGGAEGILGLWIFLGIMGFVGGVVGTLFTSVDIRESQIKVRNHRRELEDLMMEEV